MTSEQYVNELAVKGQKFVETNYSKIKLCFNKVFTDKQLCKKLDLNNWPAGKKKDRGEETIKTLMYLFKKLYVTYANCNDKNLRCLYCDAIDKYIILVRLAYSASYNIETLEILRELLLKLTNIQKLGICKCKFHVKNYKPVKVDKQKKYRNSDLDSGKKNKKNNDDNKNKVNQKVDLENVSSKSEELKQLLSKMEADLKSDSKNVVEVSTKQDTKLDNKSNDTDNTASLIEKCENLINLKNKYINDEIQDESDIETKTSYSSIVPLIKEILGKLDSVEESCKTATINSELSKGTVKSYDFKQDASQINSINDLQSDRSTPVNVTINNVYPKSGYKLSGVVCYCLQCHKIINEDSVDTTDNQYNNDNKGLGFPVVCCKCHIEALNKYK